MKRALATSLLFPMMAFAGDALCPDLNMLQRAAGYAGWVGLLQVLAGLALLGGILYVFWGAIEILLEQKSLLEILIWCITALFVIGAYFLGEKYQTGVLIVGAGLFAGAMAFSAHVREKVADPLKFSLVLLVVWGAMALFYQSGAVGFMAVGALVSALGFSVLVTPGCYAFGYTNEDSVSKGTVAGLFVMILYGALRAFYLNFGIFAVFESGALWLGSFVGFIGLLILSSTWHDNRESLMRMFRANVIMILMLALAISFGALFAIKELSTIGVAFLLLYVAAKLAEVRTEQRFTFGLKLICIGVFFGGMWLLFDRNQATLAPYLMYL